MTNQCGTAPLPANRVLCSSSGRDINVDPELVERLHAKLGDRPVLCVGDFKMVSPSIAVGKDFRVWQSPHPQVKNVWFRHVALTMLTYEAVPILQNELVTSQLDTAAATALAAFCCTAYGIKGVG